MTRTPDLFPDTKPARQAPRKLMHVIDASSGCSGEDDASVMVRMRCARCGYESRWLAFRTATDAKRGSPCPKCNVGAA